MIGRLLIPFGGLVAVETGGAAVSSRHSLREAGCREGQHQDYAEEGYWLSHVVSKIVFTLKIILPTLPKPAINLGAFPIQGSGHLV
jgi:hypothetical protein